MKNETLVLDVNEDDTILNTKAKFEDQYEQYNGKNLKFIYKGKILEDFKTIKDYDVEENQFVVVLVSLKQG